MRDVAAAAGVSVSTVSRVLNGTGSISRETVARVLAAAERVRYRPSNVARSLRARRSSTFGLLISDIQNPFFTALVRGVEDVTQRNGYNVILCNSDEDQEKERKYVELLCAEQVAGAIVVPASERSHSFEAFEEMGIPFIAVDRCLESFEVDAVMVDNHRGAYDAVSHLIASGYRRIALITGPLSTTTGRVRRDGYRKALSDAGLAAEPSIERIGSYKADSGQALAGELVGLAPPPDALFVSNNQMALGALQAVYDRKIRIPEELGFVCFDDMPWAALEPISITTVRQPIYELGSTAATRLLNRVLTPDKMTRQEFVLTPKLCVRSSSLRQAGRTAPPSSTSGL